VADFDSLQFEWDKEKASRNWRVHGVIFEEALSVFGDPLARIFPDYAHSEGEDRYLLLGESESGRKLYSERSSAVRIISARLATRRGRDNYEQTPS
jgi:uncharacterized DUF497 family protein